MRTAEQLKLDISHIIDSGMNDIRIMELIKSVVSEACKEQREICAGYEDDHLMQEIIKNAPEPNI